MPFAAVLLDLDGTLLNTITDLATAANAMRVDMDLTPLPQEVLETYVGKGTRHLVVQTLSNGRESMPPAPQIERGLELFNLHYHRVNGDQAVLYPGVIKGLEAFRGQGLRMAIVTNKSSEFTRPLVERMGIAHFFEHVVCGDTCPERKPHPMPMLHACELLQVAPSDALAIGDSINDAQAARAANIKVLAVPYGYNEGQDVHTLEVDDIVISIEAAARWAAEH